MPKIGDKLAYDYRGVVLTTIVAVLGARQQSGYVVKDDRGETHIAVPAGPGVCAPFYVDHLAEAFQGTQFQL